MSRDSTERAITKKLHAEDWQYPEYREGFRAANPDSENNPYEYDKEKWEAVFAISSIERRLTDEEKAELKRRKEAHDLTPWNLWGTGAYRKRSYDFLEDLG